ncbi:CsgG/HfaB family protein [Dokdonia sinensis]|nr:CsgG/HfaB family protein [Dokdonia sinensis]
MKRILLLSFVIFSQIALSQKTSIALLPFESQSSLSPQANAIYDQVKEAFVATNRFDIVDRSNYSKINSEKELQKTEAFMNSDVIAQDNSKGAQQLVAGKLISYSNRLMQTEKSAYYKCNVSFSLDVLDVETGQVIHSKTITPKDSFMGSVLKSSMGGNSSPEAAFGNTLVRMQKYIDEFIQDYFPVETQIIDIQEVKKDEAKNVLVNVGTQTGTKKKDEFIVYEITFLEVGGKKTKREVEIGKFRIDVVEGAEISSAKVTKGGEAILEKFKSNAKLICKSTL